jgi:hypothetical protein
MHLPEEDPKSGENRKEEYYHHHQAILELGHWMIGSGLTYPGGSSKVSLSWFLLPLGPQFFFIILGNLL